MLKYHKRKKNSFFLNVSDGKKETNSDHEVLDRS